MKGEDIPSDFINRDLRDTQYIAKKAKSILEELVKNVVSTSGSITDRLRQDWQLVDVMQELNWEKYDKLGLTEIIENREGHKIKRIKDWTKRNDHRHHAMDALTIAFTKRSHIQYLNNLNARSDKGGSIYGIETKELERDDKGKLRFKAPIPLKEFRAEAKKHLENTLISIKAKNKVATININTTDKKNGVNKKKQLTPRGQLHLETVYGSIQQYATKEEKVNADFNEEQILKVAKKSYREALLNKLKEFDNDPKKAFTGKNSLDKNPIYLDIEQTQKVPVKVKIVYPETIFTIRKDISPDLKIEKVIDSKIKVILEARLKEFNGDAKKAFSNLDEFPIWLNKEKGISIKRVTIKGISNAVSLHEKRDKEGKPILDNNGNPQPVDFVNTGNNHHVAIYQDENGNLQENVVSFFEATIRINQGLSIIDKEYKNQDGWKFLFSMKQNEYFVFPNEKTGFNPNDIDLLSPDNYNLISQNLFRVQKISTKNYVFNHHLETTAVTGETLKNRKQLLNITHRFIQSLPPIKEIVKVRINHIGQIVCVGEY
jgi:CRISPR-associated endonuclease Csn1